jgi:hypothetical protein
MKKPRPDHAERGFERPAGDGYGVIGDSLRAIHKHPEAARIATAARANRRR